MWHKLPLISWALQLRPPACLPDPMRTYLVHFIQTFVSHLKPLHHLHLDLRELDALNLKAAARVEKPCLALDQLSDRLLSLEGKSCLSCSLLWWLRFTENKLEDIPRVLTASQWLQPAGANQEALTLASLTWSPPPTLGWPTP